MLQRDVAALAEHVEEEDGALERIDPVVRDCAETLPGSEVLWSKAWPVIWVILSGVESRPEASLCRSSETSLRCRTRNRTGRGPVSIRWLLRCYGGRPVTL